MNVVLVPSARTVIHSPSFNPKDLQQDPARVSSIERMAISNRSCFVNPRVYAHAVFGLSSYRMCLRPLQLEPLLDEQRLEILQDLRILPHLVRRVYSFSQAERRQQPGRLADVPLHRVQAVAAVGDVGDAQVLAGRQQVLAPAPAAARPAGSGRAARRCRCNCASPVLGCRSMR